MTPCSSCNTPTDRLELFPNDLCVECYSTTAEANRPITAEELARMWGGKI